jgi:hypothetical protein
LVVQIDCRWVTELENTNQSFVTVSQCLKIRTYLRRSVNVHHCNSRVFVVLHDAIGVGLLWNNHLHRKGNERTELTLRRPSHRIETYVSMRSEQKPQTARTRQHAELRASQARGGRECCMVERNCLKFLSGT